MGATRPPASAPYFFRYTTGFQFTPRRFMCTILALFRIAPRKTPPVNCTHLPTLHAVTPSAPGCEKCLQSADPRVPLRISRAGRLVGCRASAKNKHAMNHYQGWR